MDLMASDLGIACQCLIMKGQFWLQKRSFSRNATLGMVSLLPLLLPLFWFWYNWWGVPVIAVLTKADALNVPAFHQLKKECQGICEELRVEDVTSTASQLLNNLRGKIESQLKDSKYPPKAYLSLASESWRIWYHVCSNGKFSFRDESRGCWLHFIVEMHNRCTWCSWTPKIADIYSANQHCLEHGICHQKVKKGCIVVSSKSNQLTGYSHLYRKLKDLKRKN